MNSRSLNDATESVIMADTESTDISSGVLNFPDTFDLRVMMNINVDDPDVNREPLELGLKRENK